MTDVMFRAPWRGICDDVCAELAGDGTQTSLPWEHGEPSYWYRVQPELGGGWVVARYTVGEPVEAPF